MCQLFARNHTILPVTHMFNIYKWNKVSMPLPPATELNRTLSCMHFPSCWRLSWPGWLI